MVVARIVTCAASISVARLESRGPPRIAILLVPRVWLAQVSPRDPGSTRKDYTKKCQIVTKANHFGWLAY